MVNLIPAIVTGIVNINIQEHDMDYVKMIVPWIIIGIIRVVLFTIGLPIVAIAIRNVNIDDSTTRAFSEYRTTDVWKLVTLPKWAWLWSNDSDGAWGDKRGWWSKENDGNHKSLKAMWMWLAVRNPVNNLRYLKGISAYMPDLQVELLKGQGIVDDYIGMEGFQILKAKGKYMSYYNLYWVPKAKNGKFPFYVMFGHKIKLSHNATDWSKETELSKFKGLTFRIRLNRPAKVKV